MKNTSSINEAKASLPLPLLMERLGYGEHAKKSAKCPFHHPDRNPSFGIFEKDGHYGWMCHTGCGSGDEIDFLAKATGKPNSEAVKDYLEMAGKRSQTESPKPKFRWKKYRESANANAGHLAAWRGYSTEFCEWLASEDIVGCRNYQWAIAIRDEAGQIVGAHLFQRHGRPSYDTSGDTKVRPLIFGDVTNAKTFFVFESQWDAFAFWDRWNGRSTEGYAVLCTRGAGNGSKISSRIPAGVNVVAFPQNDRPEDYPDKPIVPSEKWLHDVIAHAGEPVYVARVPSQHKDLNDWTKAGATAEEIQDAIDTAEQVEGGEVDTDPEPTEPSLADVLESALITAPELVSMDIELRSRMLGHFYHEADLGFIFAPRGGGKTWLAMLIAQARANCCPLGEWEAGERPGKVLYIDGEMHAADSQGRARAIQMDNPNLIWLHGDILFDRTERTLNLGLKEYQDAIMEMCVRTGVTEVILDNISSLVRGMKENDGDDWREGLLPWLLALRRRKIGVIAVHHAGRNGEMRGTSQREDHANWIIKITPTGDDDRQGAEFVTTFTKLRADPRQCPPLKWRLHTNPVGLLHYQCEPHTSMEAFVGHVLAGVSSASELAELMQVAKGTISKWAKKAEQEGQIKIANGSYLPPN